LISSYYLHLQNQQRLPDRDISYLAGKLRQVLYYFKMKQIGIVVLLAIVLLAAAREESAVKRPGVDAEEANSTGEAFSFQDETDVEFAVNATSPLGDAESGSSD
jgi:hypothetical protein